MNTPSLAGAVVALRTSSRSCARMLRLARRPVSSLLLQCNRSAGLVGAQQRGHSLSRRAQSTAASAESAAGLLITERCAQVGAQ